MEESGFLGSFCDFPRAQCLAHRLCDFKQRVFTVVYGQNISILGRSRFGELKDNIYKIVKMNSGENIVSISVADEFWSVMPRILARAIKRCGDTPTLSK